MLNDVFVAGLPDLLGLPVHTQWSRRSLHTHALVCRSHVFGPRFLFAVFFQFSAPRFFIFQLFSENSVKNSYMFWCNHNVYYNYAVTITGTEN